MRCLVLVTWLAHFHSCQYPFVCDLKSGDTSTSRPKRARTDPNVDQTMIKPVEASDLTLVGTNVGRLVKTIGGSDVLVYSGVMYNISRVRFNKGEGRMPFPGDADLTRLKNVLDLSVHSWTMSSIITFVLRMITLIFQMRWNTFRRIWRETILSYERDESWRDRIEQPRESSKRKLIVLSIFNDAVWYIH